MTKKLDLPILFLAAAAFLAPLIGGQVAVDSLGLAPGADPFVSALMGASETPTLSHAILALLCSAALVTSLLQRRIMQVPNNTVGSLFVGLLALIVSTIGVSSYRGVSIPAAMEWVTYGMAFYATVAVTGRQKGPTILLTAMFASCVLLALLGLREYGDMKAIDPTWRIFPQWVGPNALAAILVVGFFSGLGLAINSQRPANLGYAAGCVAIGLAVFLTQSKGALLALAVSLIAFAILLLRWLPKADVKRAAAVTAATVAAIVVLSGALSLQGKGSAASGGVASPGARLVNSNASSDQSVGFRKLLWKSAIEITKKNPMGIGIGTFQFESGRPGLTTQTHFAHEAYLQLAAEATLLAPILLFAGLALWSRLLLRGGEKLRSSQNVLRACVFAAILSVVGHSFIDSDFSYYGIGLPVFMFLGLGLLLSSDAVAPEFLPANFRRLAAAGVGAFTLVLAYLGYLEAQRAQVRGYIETKGYNQASSILESLRGSAPWDAEVWALSASLEQDQNKKIEYIQHAIDAGPTTRNLRLFARLVKDKKPSDALGAVKRAVEMDPNNLQTLTLLADLQASIGQDGAAIETLHRLVAVEETDYFKVRSLPELVPTETFGARLKLAMIPGTQPKDAISLLQPAVTGYKQYLSATVPNIVRFAKNPGGPLSYGGESLESTKKTLATATDAAKRLADAYRAVGDTVKAVEADADVAAFGAPLDLPSDKKA